MLFLRVAPLRPDPATRAEQAHPSGGGLCGVTEPGVNIRKSQSQMTQIGAKMCVYSSIDPSNTSITLNTLVKAAHFMGKKLHVTFV